MSPLGLVALLALGADPSPGPYIPAECLPKAKPLFIPRRAYDRMKEKADALHLASKAPPAGPSFLYQPAYKEDFVIRLPARSYELQPGDIPLAADTSRFWTLMHHLAGTSHPTHSMIVFALPDGRPAILEGGPHDTVRCRILEAQPHLASYEADGRVWVRRRKVPLTPMQSARLTEFCLALNCRAFSIRRLAVQLTPLRSRGPLRTAFVGKPRGMDREAYYCSELVCEACVYAGLMDAATTRPSATYPRDLFFGDSINPYLHRHLGAMNCDWEAPARWTACPIDSAAKP
jgi:hypothetical protein